jgi:putative Holliday junction resolvase
VIPKCLAIDFGTERIGTAVNVGELVLPGETISTQEFPQWYVGNAPDHLFLVVGLPIDLGGQRAIAASKVLQFAESLDLRDGVKIRYVDERLTTAMAQKRLRSVGKNSRTSKPLVDAVSAAVILETAIQMNPLTPGKDIDELG